MKFILSFLSFLSLIFFSLSYAETTASPLGYWKTIDDVTGKPKSILHIYEDNNLLYGQVVKLFPKPGHTQYEACQDCKGVMHNKVVLGTTIMQGLKQDKSDDSQWKNGKILDPISGKTYRCNLTVTDNGQKLNVRGYIGFSVFGRTQTWLKVENENVKG